MRYPLLVLALGALASAVKTPATEDFYHAAVVEYHPLIGRDGNETLRLNVEQYVTIIAEVAKYADIVVFPEAALLFMDSTVYMQVPLVTTDKKDLHPALRNLSSAAQENGIYVVVNLHEEETTGNSTNRYNTNVVFDRNGTIIARYRKYNLFSEHLNTTKSPEHIFFDTDFGVRFGTFTCFDILFKEPTLALLKYNITDFVFPTWWFSELPFLTAIQEQAAWAYATDSNLLAANGNLATVGTSGSGIFAGKQGPVIYYQGVSNGNFILSAKVYKKGKSGTSVGEMRNITTGESGRYKMKTDRLDYYDTLPLGPVLPRNGSLLQNSVFEENLCQGKFCCHFSINMTFVFSNDGTGADVTDDDFSRHHYRVAVFDGVRSFDGYATGGIQACGVISCLNGSAESCGRPTLGAPSTKLGNLVLQATSFNGLLVSTSTLDPAGFPEPSVLETGAKDHFGSLPSTDRFKFSRKGSSAELRLQSSEKLATAAIFSRVFSRDGSPVGRITSSSSLINASAFAVVLAVFIPILYFYTK